MDPYKILGVSPSASDDEVKRAYRNLSRKYHPDANINNPNKDQAEEMFKNVQAAYDQIMKERQQGSTFNGYGGRTYGSGSGTGGFGTGGADVPPEMQAAVNYIRSGHPQEAMTALLQIDERDRNGLWYFLASVSSQGMGNMVNAKTFIDRAIALEPGNLQYRQFAQRLASVENGNGGWSSWYNTMGQGYGTRPYAGSDRNWCIDMILLNLACNCCCI